MPPKLKKCQSIWQKCENCSCILNYKDIDLHVEYCQLPKSQWPFGFIDNSVLYGFLDDFGLKELPSHINENYAKDLVFLSQSAMQLCGFPLGYPVLIETSGYNAVLKAWPTPEGSLTRVGVSLEELEIRSALKLNSNQVKVSRLPIKPFLAKEVYFSTVLQRDEDVPTLESEVATFPYKFKDKVVHNNMFLVISFYGKKVKLKINKITHLEDVVKSFEQLNLNSCFYTITENTVWINEDLNKTTKTIEKKPLMVGGYNSLLCELKQNILFTLNQNFSEPGQQCSSYCVMLYGPSGIGKSFIAQYLADSTQKPLINIQGSELFSKFYGETENRLRNVFQDIKLKAPCSVIMDNIETLGARKGSDQERRVLSTLLSLFDSIRFLPVVIIATTIDPDILDPTLRRPGRLEAEIEINIPNKEDRFEILKTLITDVSLFCTLEQVAENCHGYVAADLVSLVDKATSKAFMTSGGEDGISTDHLLWAFSQVRPSAMRELQVHVPAVRWDEIGGGQEVRLRLEQAVEWPLRHSESLKRLGIKAPKGVLLYGPPGCSKTLAAKALATETNLNFISIKGSDIFSKWVGESEKAIRNLFRCARKVAPAIIFLDEVDALGADRGSSMGSTVHDRVLSQLLTEMDGINPLDGVVIVAATNRPDCMDKALLRPGRLDRLIYVPLPDYETRLQILRIQLKKIPTRGVNIEEIAKRTDGYSGAEVVAVCTEAALAALQDDMNAEFVDMSHFTTALASVIARTPQSLLKLYDDYRKQRGH